LTGNRNGITLRELPGVGNFPTGQIPWEIPEPVFRPDTMANTRIIRIIDAALEQMRPDIEKAVAKYGPERIGVCLGSCDNGSEASLKAHQELLATGAFPQNYELRFQSASFPVEFIAAKFGIRGPVMTIATACASGASAIARGAELIRAGLCGAVIAGGADLVSETVLMGFHALEALSDSLTNPFSKNRKGINLGEGTAFFLLSASEKPRENGTVELLGVGESSDAYHMTGPGPDGAGPIKAMKAALLDAGIEPEDIGYVNLHGTGTQLNDIAEALAMKAIFGAKPPPASSTKPIMGHTLGVAGTLEAAVCWMVLTAQKGFPVHCWDGEKDEELVFHPFIPGGDMLDKMPSICMSNNFAFGGCNVSLIMGRR
jgi:3-oxoacyl-[acyl-carrier-protein] synthase-1